MAITAGAANVPTAPAPLPAPPAFAHQEHRSFLALCFSLGGLLQRYKSKHMEIFLLLPLHTEKKVLTLFSMFVFRSLSREAFDIMGRPGPRAPPAPDLLPFLNALMFLLNAA